MMGKTASALCRVSSTQQGKRGNLIGQEANHALLALDNEYPLSHVGKFEWSGRGSKWIKKLARFGKKSIDSGAKAIVVATLDRLIRSLHFDSRHPMLCKAMPTIEQVEEALHAVKLPVMIVNGPEATAESNRSLLIKWGNGGRPKEDNEPGRKKRIREKYLWEVLRLMAGGLPPRLVSHLTGVGMPTVKLWGKKYPV